MDGALVVAIVAAVFAGLAAIFAGWSAWAAHRSAELAREVVKLERDRHYRELNPHIELEHGSRAPGDDRVWFTNKGPLDYTSVAFTITDPGPIDGLKLDGKAVRHGDLGPLSVGERKFLLLRRQTGQETEEWLLALRLTCRSDQGTWTIPAEVEIPGTRFPGVDFE
jgi:hypothetical protein